jgi:hypothetical protein
MWRPMGKNGHSVVKTKDLKLTEKQSLAQAHMSRNLKKSWVSPQNTKSVLPNGLTSPQRRDRSRSLVQATTHPTWPKLRRNRRHGSSDQKRGQALWTGTFWATLGQIITMSRHLIQVQNTTWAWSIRKNQNRERWGKFLARVLMKQRMASSLMLTCLKNHHTE